MVVSCGALYHLLDCNDGVDGLASVGTSSGHEWNSSLLKPGPNLSLLWHRLHDHDQTGAASDQHPGSSHLQSKHWWARMVLPKSNYKFSVNLLRRKKETADVTDKPPRIGPPPKIITTPPEIITTRTKPKRNIFNAFQSKKGASHETTSTGPATPTGESIPGRCLHHRNKVGSISPKGVKMGIGPNG